MHKVGVIGSHDSIRCFKTVGLDVFPCEDSEKASRVLKKIAKEDYAIIYITEILAKDIKKTIDKYNARKLPAIIPIPGVDGTHNVGLGHLKKSVEHAIGADIIFGGA